jgi:colanic acid/amylovoran biosynthesis protein
MARWMPYRCVKKFMPKESQRTLMLEYAKKYVAHHDDTEKLVRGRKVNILIVGHDTFENKGCQALVYTTTRMLKDAFPDALFKVFSWDPEYDLPRYNLADIPCEFIRHKFNTNEFSPRNRFWLFLNATLKIRTDKGLYAPRYFYDAMKWADLVVVSGGDILADYGDASVKHYFFPMAVAEALGKPVYVFAQSISRYKNPELQRFCKHWLNRMALITVRERISYEYIRELGLKAPCHQTADPAFTLNACNEGRLEKILRQEKISLDGRPLVGFSVSKTVTRWGEGNHDLFVQAVAGAIDKLAENYHRCRFIFVPHVTYRSNPANDDRVVGREIYQKIVRKDRVTLIEGDYSCEELKGIIGRCDLFVGARTHATIASASQLVPTIALAYSTKAFGIMEDVLDRERSVLDVRELTTDRLVSMVNTLLAQKDDVAKQMGKRVEIIREKSIKNGELAKGLFN